MEIHTHITSTEDSISSIAEAALCHTSFIKTSPIKLLLHIPRPHQAMMRLTFSI